MMVVLCNPLHHLPHKSNTILSTKFSTTLIPKTSIRLNRKDSTFMILDAPKFTNRLISSMKSEKKVSEPSDSFKLTYLEVNTWLWEVAGVTILVDPVLVGNLDFGVPFLFKAAKKYLKNFKLSDLPEVECLLITQSFDDHCHLNTLIPLSQMFPNLQVIANPNAKTLLDPLFNNVTYLHSSKHSEIQTSNGNRVKIQAIDGPRRVGPPWQSHINGCIVTSPKGHLSLYYEPHCVYDEDIIRTKNADIIITPVIKQLVQNLTVVSGQEDAVQLAKWLNSKYFVPMNNGDLDSRGPLTSLIKSVGTIESFKELLSRELPGVKTIEPIPGVPFDIV
ncbi:uncharacterized protein [Rutidosis leptorrhynchoides]|uniref:uncharacterized protein n=1 Tax=Rutidosis leptorrhynchoides TaxID=125765 RepID=UPI003A99D6EE